MTCGALYTTIVRMSLLRGLFWVALFVFFAFCFVVLFEYGTADFQTGFVKEGRKAKDYVMEMVKPAKKDAKAKK